MARDGFRIFDSDTHVGPDARILARYLSEAEKDRLQEWEKFKSVDRNGRETYTRGQRRYRRRQLTLSRAPTDNQTTARRPRPRRRLCNLETRSRARPCRVHQPNSRARQPRGPCHRPPRSLANRPRACPIATRTSPHWPVLHGTPVLIQARAPTTTRRRQTPTHTRSKGT